MIGTRILNYVKHQSRERFALGLLFVVVLLISPIIQSLIAYTFLNLANLLLIKAHTQNSLEMYEGQVMAYLVKGSYFANETSRFQIAEIQLQLHRNDWQSAARLLNKTPNLDIQLAPVPRHAISAIVHADQGKLEEALGEFRAAFVIQPYLSPPLIKIYYALLSEHFYEEATYSTHSAKFLYLAGKFALMAGNPSRAGEFFTMVLNSQDKLEKSDLSRVYFYLGQINEEQGKIAQAQQHYSDALEISPLVEAAVALSYIDPEDRRANQVLQDASPAYPIKSTLPESNNSAQLVGYDLDTQTIGEGPLIKSVLYWKIPHCFTIPKGSQWAKGGEYLLQLTTLYNLIPNAGMEWDHVLDSGRPQGFTRPLFAAETGLTNVELTEEPREDSTTKTWVTSVSASQAIPRAGLRSDSLPTAPGHWYLEGAWVKATGDDVLLGGGWLIPRRKAEEQGVVYRWVGRARDPMKWEYLTNLEVAPPETLSAEVWLMVQNDAESPVSGYIDDIIYAEITIPTFETSKCLP